MRVRSHILAALALLCAGAAQAQVRSVEVRAPRAFGYFLGDLVRAQADQLLAGKVIGIGFVALVQFTAAIVAA